MRKLMKRNKKRMRRILDFLTRNIPDLRKKIDMYLTELNYPNIILYFYEPLILTKKEYEFLKRLGYEIGYGCIGCGGYGWIEVEEKGSKLIFYPISYYDQNYFIVLSPRGKDVWFSKSDFIFIRRPIKEKIRK